MKNFNKSHFIIIIIVSAALRLGFMFWDWSDYYVRQPSTLSRVYFCQGYGIASGYGYVREIGEPAKSHFWSLCGRVNRENKFVSSKIAGPLPNMGAIPEMAHPPGMALLVAGINRLLDMRADVPIQILGIIFDIIAAGLVYWISAAAFNRKVGLTSGLLYAMFPPLVRASIDKSPDGLITFFLVASFFCMFIAANRSSWKSLIWYTLSGFLLGLGSYLRPDFILLPLFMIIGLWAYKGRLTRSICAMVLTQMVVFLILFPWAYRNYNLSNRWIFSSTMVGAVLITGLGEYNNPWGFGPSDSDRHKQAVAQGIPSPWSSEADLYFRELFIKSVRENPTAFIKAVVLRLPLAIMPLYEWGFDNPLRSQIKAASRTKGHMDNVLNSRLEILKSRPIYIFAAYWDRLLIIAFSLCCLISVVILLMKEWRRRGLILFLMCPHLYAIFSHLLTHMEPRFLLPSMYCWIIGLGYVFGCGWRKKSNTHLILK